MIATVTQNETLAVREMLPGGEVLDASAESPAAAGREGGMIIC
jgi:hypothetical protein